MPKRSLKDLRVFIIELYHQPPILGKIEPQTLILKKLSSEKPRYEEQLKLSDWVAYFVKKEVRLFLLFYILWDVNVKYILGGVFLKVLIIRKERGLTQTDLAGLCETSQQQIAKIEGGLVDPKLSTLRKIAESLEVDMSQLFYSKSEFLNLLNDLINEEGLSKGKISVAILNGLASELKKVPKYHPFWEKVELKKNKVFFMEEKNV